MPELQVSIGERLTTREEKMRYWLVLEEGFIEVLQVGVDVLILLSHGPQPAGLTAFPAMHEWQVIAVLVWCQV
jgi:hypothetical protein